MKKVRTKRTKKKTKALLFKAALVLLTVFVVFQLISLQSSISKKQQQLVSLETQVSELSSENEQMQQQLDQGVTEEYIESVAREQLGYVSPFERVFVDVAGE